jgi:hypothetical protein
MDLVKNGRAGDNGSRQETKLDPTLDLIQRRKTIAGGAAGEESGEGEPS